MTDILEWTGDPKPRSEWTDDEIEQSRLEAEMEREDIEEDRRLFGEA